MPARAGLSKCYHLPHMGPLSDGTTVAGFNSLLFDKETPQTVRFLKYSHAENSQANNQWAT